MVPFMNPLAAEEMRHTAGVPVELGKGEGRFRLS